MRCLFLERDKPWYRENRDLPTVSYAAVHLYETFAELDTKYSEPVAKADLVIVGSYVPEGVAVGDWVQRTPAGSRHSMTSIRPSRSRSSSEAMRSI